MFRNSYKPFGSISFFEICSINRRFFFFKNSPQNSFRKGTMFGSDERPTILDVVRSMKRLGFSYEEIYDVLTSAGISSGEVELFLDRIEVDFDDIKIKSKKSRIGEELEKVFKHHLKKIKIEINSEIRILKEKIKSTNTGIERLEQRINELQKINKTQNKQALGAKN